MAAQRKAVKAEAPAPRSIPGAGPLASKGKPRAAAAAANGGGKNDMAKAAHAAALSATAPPAGKVDKGLKVQRADVAEEAERQTAFAAVEILEQKENGSQHAGGEAAADHDPAKGALQAVLAKRIKVLNKKLQRAIQYEVLDQSKVNDDQRRIVASKPGLEASVSELREMAKALEIAEKESQKVAKAHERQSIALAIEKARADADKKLSTLFQLLHLYSFITPSAQAAFAAPAMPPVLETATGQEVASVGKLYSDLAASNEVTPNDAKSNHLDKLASGSKDEILEGVTFRRIRELLEGLSVPVTQQSSSAPEVATPAPTNEPSTGQQISFIQASELEQSQKAAADAPADVTQAEPEGGAVDSVPTDAIQGGATDKGQAGANGAILGEDVTSSTDPAADGSAKAAVSEPVQTTELSRIESAAPVHKVIDWSANDDDDFGDLEIQPNGVNGATVQPAANATSAVAQGQTVTNAEAPSKGRTDRNNGGQRRSSGAGSGRQPRSRNSSQQQQAAAPAKSGPEMDEDGFVVASSKRSKFLQEKQQQQQQARGGRGASGRGGRGGQGAGRSGGTAGSGRGGENGGGRGRSSGRGREVHSSITGAGASASQANAASTTKA